MLGGINNGLFLQSFGGFLGLALLIFVLKWGFSSNRKMIVTPIKAGKKDQGGSRYQFCKYAQVTVDKFKI